MEYSEISLEYNDSELDTDSCDEQIVEDPHPHDQSESSDSNSDEFRNSEFEHDMRTTNPRVRQNR
jgi:hypothetical protein